MINIKDLSFSYSGPIVLNHIQKQFETIEVHGIAGLNGSGKTTFFNILSKTLRPSSGHITFGERDLVQQDTGFLETSNFFYSMITGHEYLKIFDRSNTGFDLSALQQYLNLPLDELIETYSTGMKKKLALLAILKQDKPIYLFDEPFNGLDLETNKVLELIILALREKGKTIFLSSHIMEPLLMVCDKIHILENGAFGKSYIKEDFSKIEHELFGKFKAEAKEIISHAV